MRNIASHGKSNAATNKGAGYKRQFGITSLQAHNTGDYTCEEITQQRSVDKTTGGDG